MAEAHSAVAFSFQITHEGLNINYDLEVLNVVWQSGIRSWSRRLRKIKNNFVNGIYPATLWSYIVLTLLISAISWLGIDILNFTSSYINLIPFVPSSLTLLLSTILLWTITIYGWRFSLSLMLLYKGWLYENRVGKPSWQTKLWAASMRFIQGKNPKLYSYQGSLPHLPLPKLHDTMTRYLESIRPLCDDATYLHTVQKAKDFENGIGRKLQRYLWLKSCWATNYVSDWWEEFVYLQGRTPLMINSNFYALDALLTHPTTSQAARAANIVYGAMLFRRGIDRQLMKPIMLQNLVPLCSSQYERTFNTVRIPGVGKDKLVHFSDSQHIVVYHKGCYYKLPVYYLGRLLQPAELQKQLEYIVNNDCQPLEGEEHLGALTASDRETWAKARMSFFSKGINRVSLGTIEKAAFILVLDQEEYTYDPKQPEELDKFGQAMLHGKGYDRWYDKSFNIIVGKNGRIGLNAEHSWADAPIIGHFWEFCLAQDFLELGYDQNGNTRGTVDIELHPPQRLVFDLSPQCITQIEQSVLSAQVLVKEVDLHLYVHDHYGKGFMKKCKVSPDAYIQMALQLAYYRDTGKFSLTYEASMTRLYREGRTETVRPVTTLSCDWVRAMAGLKSVSVKERQQMLVRACDKHQHSYQDAMCGKGMDRHLFCLYVISKYLEVDSPFLKEILCEPWRLSTSQTPHGQTTLLDVRKNPEYISAGGGFGPVADDGYGVSYIIAGENTLFFHISSKRSSPETDSHRFGAQVQKALNDMRQLFETPISSSPSQ